MLPYTSSILIHYCFVMLESILHYLYLVQEIMKWKMNMNGDDLRDKE